MERKTSGAIPRLRVPKSRRFKRSVTICHIAVSIFTALTPFLRPALWGDNDRAPQYDKTWRLVNLIWDSDVNLKDTSGRGGGSLHSHSIVSRANHLHGPPPIPATHHPAFLRTRLSYLICRLWLVENTTTSTRNRRLKTKTEATASKSLLRLLQTPLLLLPSTTWNGSRTSQM